jgi:hypothetical protein
MSDPIYKFRDSNLSLYQVNSSYTLLMQIYPASFSYAIAYQNKLMAWAENCALEVLDDPGDDHELLTFDYKNVITALPATGFTLVPNAIFIEDKVADIARFLDVKPDEKVFAQPLDDENHIVYKVNGAAVETAEIYGLQKAVFIGKGWITAIAKNYPPDCNLYLNITGDQLEVLYFVGGKLRFYNAFEFKNPDEFTYYTAFVVKELQLSPKGINLVLSGDVKLGDKNTERLAAFFNGVELNHLRLLDAPAEVLSHQILALAALTLCASSEVY